MYKLFFAIFLFCGSVAHAQLEYPSGVTSNPEVNLQWNRYKSENFAILSLDDSQGKWLNSNIELMRKWCLIRWGFPEENFTKECRIFCVPDRKSLKRLFGIDQSKFEVRKKGTELELTVLWLVLDETPTKSIFPYLSEVCFVNYEYKNHVKLSWWFKNGASAINGSISENERQMTLFSDVLKKDSPIFPSSKVFTFTEEDYLKESLENKRIFDQQSILLCMMLRKEFGEAKLHGFLRMANKNNPKEVLSVVYEFRDFNHFDKQYIRYMKDFTSEVVAKKVPVTYWEITPIKK